MTDKQLNSIVTKQTMIDLAQMRFNEAELIKKIIEQQNKVDATPEAQELKKLQVRKQELSSNISLMTEFIKKSALDEFINTKVKPVLAGLTQKTFKKFVLDKTVAEPWAKEHEPGMFKFDEKAFEKYARALIGVKEVPGVKFEDDPKVEIASDLSEYLN